MRTRFGWQGAWLVAALVVPGHSNLLRQPTRSCDLVSGRKYHGELSDSITRIAYSTFANWARNLSWVDSSGVRKAPRRADCGARCIYSAAGNRNQREDNPPLVLADNHAVCDAGRIELKGLPKYGVLIGRIVYQGSVAGGPVRNGDASFNIGDGKFNGKKAREAVHYVLLTPGTFVIPEYHAIWKLVALRPPSGKDSGEVMVVDSGLFRVCLPEHQMPEDGEVLASFRSCADAKEFDKISRMRNVQQRAFGVNVDSTAAQRRLYSLLIRGDRSAFDSVLTLRSVLFPDSSSTREEEEPSAETPLASTGPFAVAVEADLGAKRRLVSAYRYGDLHPDAPMWYVCHGGCCSGEPW